MFQIIARLTSCIHSILYYGFTLSFTTGKTIVSLISYILQNIFSFTNTAWTLLHIIGESVYIFLLDLLLGCQFIFATLTYCTKTAVHAILIVWTTVGNSVQQFSLGIYGLANFISNAVSYSVLAVKGTFVFLKNLLVLFGSGIWFAITIIPLCIAYLCIMFVYFVGTVLNEIYSGIVTGTKSITTQTKLFAEFLIDTPIESLLGLASALCIAYIFMQFYVIIFAYLLNKLAIAYDVTKTVAHHYCNEFGRLLRKIFVNPANNRRTRRAVEPRAESRHVQVQANPVATVRERVTKAFSRNNSFDIERYCCVCQERMKCILLLPCKHVCMCLECSVNIMYNYNNSCPICRRKIDETMKIFV